MRLPTVLIVLAGAVGLCAQPGPAIGTRVPEFQLIDQRGTSRTLASTLGPQGGLLVFFRSADW